MPAIRSGPRWQLAAALAALVVFAALMTLVVATATGPVDRAVLEWVRQTRTSTMSDAMRGLTFFGDGVVVAVATAIIVVGLWRRSPRSALFSALAIGGAGLLNRLFKWTIERARPALEDVSPPASYAFPSGHAMGTFALVLTLWLVAHRHGSNLRGVIAAIGAPFALGMGISRVYLGVHYPSDVVAGWALATGWILLVDLWYRRHPPTGGV